MTIACLDRVQHRQFWAVLDRDRCRGDNSGTSWETPGTSTLTCLVCQVAWRSRAKYVAQMPDLPPRGPVESERSKRIRALCELHPLLAELTYHDHRHSLAHRVAFLRSVGNQLDQYGRLSERQIEVAQEVILQKMELP